MFWSSRCHWYKICIGGTYQLIVELISIFSFKKAISAFFLNNLFSRSVFQQSSKKKAQRIWSLKYASLNATAYHHLLELSSHSSRYVLLALTAFFSCHSAFLIRPVSQQPSTCLNFLNLSLLHLGFICTTVCESQHLQRLWNICATIWGFSNL